jgi:flagellar biosynthesis/type III secretory pathway protein FliH
MERIEATDGRITGLAAALVLPQQSFPETAVPVRAPDPALLLEQERNRIFEEARKLGFAQGMKDADQKIQAATEQAQQKAEAAHAKEVARLRDTCSRLELVLRNIPPAMAEVDEQILAASVEIAYASVLRVIGKAHADGDLIHGICQQALDEYRQRPVILCVSSADYPSLGELTADESIRIQADATLTSGQCRLETAKGLYGTSLEVRLDALKQAFIRHFPESVEAT